MFYTAIENGEVGCKCTRCKKFIPEAEFTPPCLPMLRGDLQLRFCHTNES
jgi:hypothetical protein